MQIFRNSFALLNRKEKAGFFLVGLAALATGIVQIIGVGSVIPFVSLLVDQEIPEGPTVLTTTYHWLGFESRDSFLIFLGVCVLTLVIVGNAVTALTIWLMTRYCWAMQRRLSLRLLQNYMSCSYVSTLNKNSSEFIRNVLIESMQFSSGTLMPMLSLFAYGMNALMIFGFLFWIQPQGTLLALCTFILGYGLLYRLVRKPFERYGKIRLQANKDRLKYVTEAFSSFKAIKVSGHEDQFVERFRPSATQMAHATTMQQTLTKIPRYGMEALAFGVIMCALLYMLQNKMNIQQSLPQFAAFAFAGYRLIPVLQNLYTAFGSLRFNAGVLDTIYSDLHEYAPDVAKKRDVPLSIGSGIRIRHLHYSYPGTERHAIDDISLRIKHPSFVALVGRTGAGKSTLADLLLGLLKPDSGSILIGEDRLTDGNLGSWQRLLGYVPQEIYLMDDSIAANIAFGVPGDKIDMKAVEKAAAIANIDEFIREQLPDGYQTVVGERGVRISGGQRQRIGLARALYYDPPVLIMDEATSALDNLTEAAVHEAILNASKVKTVIVIAHRFSTITGCEQIFLLDEGRLVASGSYDDVLDSSEAFRALANSGQSDGGQ